jgi:hypothetical protein
MHDGKNRDIEGLITAWTAFEAEVLHTMVTTDISSDPDTIIWADLGFLRKHYDIHTKLLKLQQHLILVPYQERTLLDEIFGPTTPTNIVPIQKPLIWHRIVQTIIDTRKIRTAPNVDKDIKYAPKTEAVHNSANESNNQRPEAKRRTVLLVEDNKVFRKSSY